MQPVDVHTLKQWMDAGQAVLVDVREPVEHAGLRVPAAQLHPLSKLDPRKLADTGGRKLVLHCRTGGRSKQACQKVVAAGCNVDLYYLDGGIEAWQKAGLPTIVDRKAPLDLQRQVQLVVGTGVLTFTLLGVFVSPWFLIVPGFFGAGLMFAGATGTCGMAMMLAKMPWNKA